MIRHRIASSLTSLSICFAATFAQAGTGSFTAVTTLPDINKGSLLVEIDHSNSRMYVGNRYGLAQLLVSTDQGANWTPRTIGDMTNLTALRTDPVTGTLYAAGYVSSGGSNQATVFQSDDAGASWKKLSTGGLEGIGSFSLREITSFAFDRTSNIYIQTADGNVGGTTGIFRLSNDAGANWQLRTPSVSYAPLWMSPDEVLFSGGRNGLFKSTDGGVSWVAGGLNGGGDYTVYALIPDASGTLYAATSAGVVKSSDKGETWTKTTETRATLGLAVGADGTLYSLAKEAAVRRSVDGGSTWVDIPGLDAAQSLIVDTRGNVFAVKENTGIFQYTPESVPDAKLPEAPAKPVATIYSASALSVAAGTPLLMTGSGITGYIAKCSDGASTLSRTSLVLPIRVGGISTGVPYTCSLTALTASGESASSEASNSISTLAPTVPGAPVLTGVAGYNASSVSVSFSAPASNGGKEILSYNANCSDGVGKFSGSAAKSPILVGGLEAGKKYTCTVAAVNALGTGAESSVSAPVSTVAGWEKVASLPPVGAGVTTSRLVAFDDANGLIFVGNRYGTPSLLVSNDQGASWVQKSIGALDNLSALAFDPERSTLYAAGYSSVSRSYVTRVYRSKDGGNSWEMLTESGLESPVTSFSLAPIVAMGFDSSGTIYAGTEYSSIGGLSGLLRLSADAGATWKWAIPGGPFDAFVIDKSNTLIFGSKSGLYKTADGGKTVEEAGLNVAYWPKYVAASYVYQVSSDAKGNLYAATLTGIAKSLDGGKTWQNTNEKSQDLSVAAGSDGTLYAAAKDGPVRESKDGGNTWRDIAGLSGARWLLTNSKGGVYAIAGDLYQYGAAKPDEAASVPGAPAITGVQGGNLSISVSFTAPAATGASPISGYTAKCNDGVKAVSGTGATSPIVVSGLTAGANYTCTVSASNAQGAGAESTPSAKAIPTGISGVATGPVSAMSLAATIVAAKADQGASGKLYIGAFLKGVGAFMFTEKGGWVAVDDPGVDDSTPEGLVSAAPLLQSYHTAPVTLGAHAINCTGDKPIDLTSLKGTVVFAGYAVGDGTAADMMKSNSYQPIFVVP